MIMFIHSNSVQHNFKERFIYVRESAYVHMSWGRRWESEREKISTRLPAEYRACGGA